MCYIITLTDYLTRWAKSALVKYFTTMTAVKFLFESVVIRFGCPKIILSDQGTHFVNKMIDEITTEFQIQHKNMTTYHPQANAMVVSFNKILENALTKVCNVHRYDRDQKVSVVLWACCTT